MRRGKFLMLMGLAGLALVVAALPWGVDQAYGNAGPAGATFYANSPILTKFVDSLPGLGPTHPNNLGNFIPIATKMTDPSGRGDDYYEIGLVDYTQRMHSGLPKLTRLRGYKDLNPLAPPSPNSYYLGPVIIAQRNKPVRLKFTNQLGKIGAGGDLFIPVDTTVMGAGMGPDGMNSYTENRAGVHLHGGFTPWISDGTPHQWITPAVENTTIYLKGVSQQNVPDMPNPGPGAANYYYTNQQSGRFMFYHDHAYGITRLNVYAGEAAGYLLWDPVEDGLITSGIIPNQGDPTGVYRYGIPLVIQDKTFVPSDIATQDQKWLQLYGGSPNWGTIGDLWFPHVYEPNQDPTSLTGMSMYGRWDYGPWFWPVFPSLPLPGTTTSNPTGYNTSIVPEAFMDTMLVNGCAYPYLEVDPKAYRFRVLNACNDRNLNLQLYVADSGFTTQATATAIINPATGTITAIGLVSGGSGYTSAPMVHILGGGGFGAWATATIGGAGAVNGITLISGGSGYTSAPTVVIGGNTEVKMVPALQSVPALPENWPTDNRDGGVPDPTTVGPSMIQIGSEGGFLPAPVVLPNQPVNYDYDRRSVTVLNVKEKNLFMGPAERADLIIDFSQFAGKTIIFYNDAPAPVPAGDPRQDYYTGDPDNTGSGGAYQTLVGQGPNTRTIMQFRVRTGTNPQYNLAALQAAWPAAYVATQDPPIVPQTGYPPPYQAATDTYSRISDNYLTFTPYRSPQTKKPMLPKTIQELFDPYGRMNATLGLELPFTSALIQTTIPLKYLDPPTEIIRHGESQIWKITHNGVDTHSIHFHLVNVQVINRVGWDNSVRPPDPNELGWKETVRMNPLEDCIIAMRATRPTLPFSVPDSVRPLDPTMPLGTTTQFTGVDANGNPITVVNQMTNFGWEYVWHCHLLGHEENDMMRPLVLRATNVAPIVNTVQR